MIDPRRLEKAISAFYELDRNLTIYEIKAFLHVATHDGGTQRALEDAMGTNPGTVHRALRVWTEHEKLPDKPGYDFIQRTRDPSDGRYRILSLTEKGREFLTTLK